MKNLALLDVFRMASIPSSSIQAFSMPTVRSVPPHKRYDNTVRSADRDQAQLVRYLCDHDGTCFGAELWCHPNVKGGKNRWVVTGEDVICAAWCRDKSIIGHQGDIQCMEPMKHLYSDGSQEHWETFHKRIKKNNQAWLRMWRRQTEGWVKLQEMNVPLWQNLSLDHELLLYCGSFYCIVKMKINTIHVVLVGSSYRTQCRWCACLGRTSREHGHTMMEHWLAPI